MVLKLIAAFSDYASTWKISSSSNSNHRSLEIFTNTLRSKGLDQKHDSKIILNSWKEYASHLEEPSRSVCLEAFRVSKDLKSQSVADIQNLMQKSLGSSFLSHQLLHEFEIFKEIVSTPDWEKNADQKAWIKDVMISMMTTDFSNCTPSFMTEVYPEIVDLFQKVNLKISQSFSLEPIPTPKELSSSPYLSQIHLAEVPDIKNFPFDLEVSNPEKTLEIDYNDEISQVAQKMDEWLIYLESLKRQNKYSQLDRSAILALVL
jgi:hypothetical protein